MRQYALDLAVHHEHVVFRSRIGREIGARPRDVRHRENREIAIRKGEPLRLVDDDVDAELAEELEDAPGLGRARAIVIAGDHHDDRVRQLGGEPRELRECVDDRGIHRAHRVKDIAGDHDDVGRERDDAIDRATKRLSDVRFALIDSGWREPMVLPEAQM